MKQYIKHLIQSMVLQGLRIKVPLTHCKKFDSFGISELRFTFRIHEKCYIVDLSQLLYAEIGQIFRI